jgi:hypothetical protein
MKGEYFFNGTNIRDLSDRKQAFFRQDSSLQQKLSGSIQEEMRARGS